MFNEAYREDPRSLSKAETEQIRLMLFRSRLVHTKVEEKKLDYILQGLFYTRPRNVGNLRPFSREIVAYWSPRLLDDDPRTHHLGILYEQGSIAVYPPGASQSIIDAFDIRVVNETKSYEHVVGKSRCLLIPDGVYGPGMLNWERMDEILSKNMNQLRPSSTSPEDIPFVQVQQGFAERGELLWQIAFKPLIPNAPFDAVVMNPESRMILPRRIVYYR